MDAWLAWHCSTNTSTIQKLANVNNSCTEDAAATRIVSTPKKIVKLIASTNQQKRDCTRTDLISKIRIVWLIVWAWQFSWICLIAAKNKLKMKRTNIHVCFNLFLLSSSKCSDILKLRSFTGQFTYEILSNTDFDTFFQKVHNRFTEIYWMFPA